VDRRYDVLHLVVEGDRAAFGLAQLDATVNEIEIREAA
jgi:hypothetical protein